MLIESSVVIMSKGNAQLGCTFLLARVWIAGDMPLRSRAVHRKAFTAAAAGTDAKFGAITHQIILCILSPLDMSRNSIHSYPKLSAIKSMLPAVLRSHNRLQFIRVGSGRGMTEGSSGRGLRIVTFDGLCSLLDPFPPCYPFALMGLIESFIDIPLAATTRPRHPPPKSSKLDIRARHQ
jgi:hypothetical protein